MESRVQLVAYVPNKRVPLLSNHIESYTLISGTGVWRRSREPVYVLTVITTQTAAEEIAKYIHSCLTSEGEQEVLITINPVTVWSPQ